jgi:hypothetical protein
MYIVALGWLYVVLMVSIAQPSVLRGVLTFIGAGLFPLAIFLYVMGSPQRRRDQAKAERAKNIAETQASEGAAHSHRTSSPSKPGSIDPDQ